MFYPNASFHVDRPKNYRMFVMDAKAFCAISMKSLASTIVSNLKRVMLDLVSNRGSYGRGWLGSQRISTSCDLV